MPTIPSWSCVFDRWLADGRDTSEKSGTGVEALPETLHVRSVNPSGEAQPPNAGTDETATTRFSIQGVGAYVNDSFSCER